ncbi:hypothetical protein F4777DRAFT_548885 [Nemania sp. FL0916]|nr:hypothetical protein F4777DRAFT_548885 [Nemania sp. FL0916]
MMREMHGSGDSMSAAKEARYAWRKRPRKFAPKSRKGCKTCKIRHIKCDLSEPHCRKCISTGRQCDGYDQDRAPYRPSAPVSVATGSYDAQRTYMDHAAWSEDQSLSQNQVQRDSCRNRVSGPITLNHNPDPLLILPLASHEEWSALQFFELRTLPRLNECRTSSSWIRTLMFFSQTVVCVRHAAIALGAVHRAYIHDPKSVRNYQLPNGKDDKVTVALHHYNVAIRSLLHSRARSNNAVVNTSIALLVCYLFTCFDSLSGSDMQAFRHLRSGIQVLTEMQKTPQEIPLGSVLFSSYELVRQITEQFRLLDGQAVTFLMDWLPQLAPDSVMSTCNHHPVKPYIEGPLYLRFSSLDQAADHLQNLVTRTLTFHHWDEEVSPSPHENPKAYLGPLPTVHATERRNQLLAQLEEWSQGFAALNANIETTNHTDQRLASMMQLHYRMSHLFLSAYTSDGEMSYDSFMPQFQTVISLAATLANIPPPNPNRHEDYDYSTTIPNPSPNNAREPSFTLEMGIIPALYLAGLKCRDPSLRRQILRILRYTHRRETLWDSFAAAQVVQRVMEIEEGCGWGGGEGDVDVDVETKITGIVEKAADIPLERRVVAAHWSPVYTGPGCIVTFELCSPDPDKRIISAVLDL